MAHITETLHQEHEALQALFDRLRRTVNGSDEDRQVLSMDLRDDLEAQARFKKDIFYPEIKERGLGAAELVDSALAELDAIADGLAQMEAAEERDEPFLARLDALEQAVRAHIRREEFEMFPLARDLIDDEEGEAMSEQHEIIKRTHATY